MPVDKHGSVKFNLTPLTPPKGSNVKYLNLAITKAVVKILHADRGAIYMKHIKSGFLSECLGQITWDGLRGWIKAQIFFSEYGHVA